MGDALHDATLISLFAERVAAGADRPAIHVRRAGRLTPLTWADVASDVWRTAAALIEAGARPGDRIALISPNRYEWITSDLAIQFARAAHVPLHNSLSGAQMAWQIVDSGARIVLLAGPEQAQKLTGQLASLPPGIRYFSFDECQDLPGVRRLADAVGAVSGDAAQLARRAAVEQVAPADLATILYTSGTTGEPKGVMLSQRNLASNALGALSAFGQQSGDLRLNWLPLSHIFARTCDMYTWIASGSELVLADSPEAVIGNCGEVHPTLINGVPYFFEKVQRWLTDQGQADAPGRLQELLGGRLRAACSGGAPLPDHVARFYNERGVLLSQGYGLTESSPVIATGTQLAMKIGTVGRAIPGVEIRISPEGEILSRGPHIMLGYWNKPDATADAVRDGWLYTGDLGEIDADGFLKITGRKKELIVTSAGKNIAPAFLEALLTEDPLIVQAVVIGDARSYLSALIVPNLDALRNELAAHPSSGPSTDGLEPAELLALPRAQDLYAARIEQRLIDVSHYEKVRRFTLLSRGLSVDQGELTLTLKLRRKAIAQNFSAEIESMYAGPSLGAGERETCAG